MPEERQEHVLDDVFGVLGSEAERSDVPVKARSPLIEELQDLENAFKGTESAILVDYKGLKVPEVTELRRQVHKAKASYKVVKNTLARRALKGTAFETLSA